VGRFRLKDIRLAGVACAVPRGCRTNGDFAERFSLKEIASVAKMTGIQTRRVANAQTCASDLCAAAATELLGALGWDRETVDVLIFVSQTPDYILPATACILQDRLGLPKRTAALDVGLGCSGYVYGLWLGASLIAARSCDRVLLLVGDTISKRVSPDDRATAMLFGDAGSATALACEPGAPDMAFVLGTDGKGAPNLIIPAGGSRQPSSSATRDRNPETGRGPEDLYMEGGEIFSFTLETVEPMVREVLAEIGWGIDEPEAFIFHQANEFMLKHLARRMRLPQGKVPLSIDRYGNTSSASIPLAIIADWQDRLSASSARLVLAGFGVGYSWGAAALEVGPLPHTRLVDV